MAAAAYAHGIPAPLMGQLERALLDCHLGSGPALQAIFLDPQLIRWQDDLPQGTSPRERIVALISFLSDRYTTAGDNALVLFLTIAAARFDPADLCHQQLTHFAAQLKPLLARTDAITPGEMAREGWAAAPPFPAPFEAPPPVPYFVGRQADIARFAQLAGSAERPFIVGLAGLRGVGKTALAIHLAHRWRDDFRDGVLWVDLSKTTPEAALISFAAAFGQEEAVARLPDTRTRAQAVHRILSTKKLLLVLDDVESSQLLEHLLPSYGPLAVLVTTDNSNILDHYPATVVELDAFTPETAVALLKRVIGEARVAGEREAVQALHRLVGGFPLALSIIAGHLADAAGLRIDEYNQLLQQEQTRVLDHLVDWEDSRRNVAASLELSYRRLPPPLPELFATLSVFGGPDFSADAVAAVAEVAPIQARLALGRLHTLSLVELGPGERERLLPEPAPVEGTAGERYRLVALLRRFARRKAESNYDQWQERAARYFAGLAEASREQEQYARLDLDWENVVAALQWAYEQQVWSILVQGVLALTHQRLGVMGFLDARGHWHEARQLLGWGLEAADQVGEPLDRIRLLIRAGGFAVRQAAFEEAGGTLQAARELLEGMAGSPEIALHKLRLAAVRAQVAAQDDRQEAAAILKRAIAEGEAVPDPAVQQEVGYLQTQLSATYARLGETTEAIAAAEAGLALLPDGASPAKLSGLINLGVATLSSGRLAESEETLQRGVEMARELGHVQHLAALWTNLALVARSRGRLDEAVDYQQRALEAYRWMGNVYYEAGITMSMGANYTRLAQDEAASHHLQKALELAQTHGLKDVEAMVFSNLAEWQLLKGEHEAAARSLEQAREICEALEMGYVLPTVVRQQAEVAVAQGEPETALTLAEEALGLAKKSGDVEEMGHCWRVKGTALSAGCQGPEAIAAWQAALTQVGNEYPYEMARIKLAMAEHYLQGETDGERVRALLGEAEETFTQLGDVRQGERVRVLRGRSKGDE